MAERQAGELIQEIQEAGTLASQGGDQEAKSQAGILNLDDVGLTADQS